AIRLSVIFQNLVKVEADPTTVTLKVMTPQEVETTYVYGVDPDITRDADGRYHFDLLIDEAGDWFYSWAGTGTVVVAEERKIRVRESVF
ncbi:MAG TPA: hypothetical protein VMX97_08705, partial [Hyphomicrobiaceae bacterium]|nr:hypothetical protein [Hyphomicrobiaceae bacterium]